MVPISTQHLFISFDYFSVFNSPKLPQRRLPVSISFIEGKVETEEEEGDAINH